MQGLPTLKAFGQSGARADFGMWNEIDEDAVKQIDVIGPEMRRPLQVQFGDPAGRLGPAFGIAMPDDLFELGDQRPGDCHEHTQTRRSSEFPGKFRLAW